MPPQGRRGDKAMVPNDVHNCPGCPHTCTGPATQGSDDVLTNGRPSVRVGDMGKHAACCGANTWIAQSGSGTVFINNRKAHRLGDLDTHCGGVGNLIEGSDNVITGG
ncbi:MAG: hypothetical protein H0T42_21685 [Deltaproteobacteria bacterium]|nr:hypothetical protein [Deltaproteobacteria bacterium]